MILAIFAVALFTRLLHSNVLWVEEAYPTTAAINILAGRSLYSDFWFDKPPLFPLLYTLWGAQTGALLRIAGASYITVCAWLMARVARNWLAGGLLAFFLIFDVPAASMVLGPDLLTLAPVLGAVLLRQRPIAAGAVLALGFHFNTKAILFLPVLWSWQAAVSFALVAAPAFLMPGYLDQVWRWGALYARDTFLENPWREGLWKTGAWLGFHAALVLAAVRAKWTRLPLLWIGAALLCAVAGFRFFPRYYFHLLPPLCWLASQALTDKARWGRWARYRFALLALLLIPLVRYAPAYWRPERSKDLAMFRDARQAAKVIEEQAIPGETLFTWGYRPEIDALSRLPGGTPFLESQPLTGVFADRHLSSAQRSVDAAQTAAHLERLAASRPVFIADGLGRYNPALAINKVPALAEWLQQYEVVAITRGTVIYRLRR
ncbi:MAG: hypothetical protein NTZ56_05055 [Acidobacteria bacterium]|nr:hypothetical protein [Acidobacteriota bacterium]